MPQSNSNIITCAGDCQIKLGLNLGFVYSNVDPNPFHLVIFFVTFSNIGLNSSINCSILSRYFQISPSGAVTDEIVSVHDGRVKKLVCRQLSLGT